MRRRLFFALIAASVVALALMATSGVAAATPFKGTVHAVEANQLVFPVLSVDRTGTGNATYLGKYREHVTLQVNVITRTSTGAATFRQRTVTRWPPALSDKRPSQVLLA